MPSITERNLTFDFPAQWDATKFDEWSFYRNQFQSVCGGTKAIDVLAIQHPACMWAIEVKDYRQHRRLKTIDIADEVACKVRDSLAALVAIRVNSNDNAERDRAQSALDCNRIGIVLHLEQPAKHSKLFPRAIDPAKVEQRLKQLLRAICAHPKVTEIANPRNMDWTVV